MKLLLLAKVLALTLTNGNDLHAHAQEDSNNPVIHALRGSVVSNWRLSESPTISISSPAPHHSRQLKPTL